LKRALAIITALLLYFSPADAQFFTAGTDAGTLRWSHIMTDHYDIIYPCGLDSLAGVFARNLERVWSPVGQSAGYVPNEMYRKKMPVVLHTQTADANGMVSWTPRRMDLQTVPDPYAPVPLPNEQLLAVHESRHVSQMQLGAAPCYKGWNIVFGELVPGFIAGIYPGRSFLEGDAVLAETALTASGRGRSADFIEYFRTGAGQDRCFQQWRYGSIKHYTPSYYATSYIGMAGVRSIYGVPDFTARYFKRIEKHHGWAFGNIHKTLREEAGTTLKTAFRTSLDSLRKAWDIEDGMRAPFMPGTKVTENPRYFKSWIGTAEREGKLITIRSGLTESAHLTSIDDNGEEKVLRPFSASVSRVRYSSLTGLGYWSEHRRDPRWEYRSYSEIRSIDSLGHIRTITHKTRMYNPSVSDTAPVLAAVSYPERGGSEICILDAYDGKLLRRIPAPEGMQVVEAVWAGGRLFTSAITNSGIGIYCPDDAYSTALPPSHAKIKQIDSRNGRILFVCDRTGVDELYELNPEDGTLLQLSNTRNGASSFAFHGNYLYYSVMEEGSKGIWKTALDSLPKKKADWGEMHAFAMAEELSAAEQEKIDWDKEVDCSEPEKYSKAAHLLHFHSWAPIYVNYDAVETMTFSSLNTAAGIGASAFWQNTLGSCYGFVGVNLFGSGWKFCPSLHAKFTYAGTYPVFEGSLDFGGRKAQEKYYFADVQGKVTTGTKDYDEPYVYGKLRIYVPLSFSSGGWSRGLVPQVSASVYDDGFHFNVPVEKKDGFVRYTSGTDRPLGRVSASVRAYSVQPVPNSRIYPKWGAGAEVGYNMNICRHYCPTLYGYIYGYLPGIGQTHGIRLKALFAGRVDNGGRFVDAYANTLPRGFSTGLLGAVAGYRHQTLLSLDYAMPIAALDWAGLCPVAYLRNLELTPHADFGLYSSESRCGSLFSAGASLTAVLNEFVRIPGLTRLGVDFSYNGGSLFESLGAEAKNCTVGLVLNISM